MYLKYFFRIIKKNYLLFCLLSCFAYVIHPEIFYLGNTDYVWGALSTEFKIFYQKIIFFDDWDNNNLGQPLLSHGYLPLYHFDRIFYFFFPKEFFFIINNILLVVKLSIIYFSLKEIFRVNQFNKLLVPIMVTFVIFSIFLLYAVSSQFFLTQLLFLILIILFFNKFILLREKKYLIFFSISFFLFSSSGMLDDAFSFITVTGFYLIYLFLTKKVNFKELILFSIVLLPSLLFLFSNLFPLYVENKIYLYNNDLGYENLINYFKINIFSGIKTFIDHTPYFLRLFMPVSLMYNDPISSLFGPLNSHIHGTFPIFFSFGFFLFLYFLITLYKKNLAKLIFFAFILLALPPGLFAQIFDKIIFFSNPSFFYLLFPALFLFLRLDNKLIFNLRSELIKKEPIDDLIYLKYFLLISVILLYFYYTEGVGIEFIIPNHVELTQKIALFLLIFLLLTIYFFFEKIFNHHSIKYFILIFVFLLLGLYTTYLLINPFEGHLEEQFNKLNIKFKLNFHDFFIITNSLFVGFISYKIINEKGITSKFFFIIISLYLIFTSILSFIHPDTYKLNFHPNLLLSNMMAMILDIFIFSISIFIFFFLMQEFKNRNLNIRKFIRSIHLLLIIHCIYVFTLHLSIAKYPFYKLENFEFINFKKQDGLNDLNYYRVNNLSSIQSDINFYSDTNPTVVSNIPNIYGYDIPGGYWIFYSDKINKIIKYSNEQILNNNISNLNLKKLFGLKYDVKIKDNKHYFTTNIGTNARYKTFNRSISFENEDDELDYIINHFDDEFIITPKKYSLNNNFSIETENIKPIKDFSQKKLFAFSAKPFDRFFLFNDNLNKGWKAKMNNTDVEIINVNFFAMGVFLPKNTEIELLFEYKPKWSKIHKITLIMSFITLCVFNLLLAISPINKYFINLNK